MCPGKTKAALTNSCWSSNRSKQRWFLVRWKLMTKSMSATYLLKDVVVYADSGVKEDWRQENIQEDISRLHTQEQSKGVANPAQIDWEGHCLA